MSRRSIQPTASHTTARTAKQLVTCFSSSRASRRVFGARKENSASDLRLRLPGERPPTGPNWIHEIEHDSGAFLGWALADDTAQELPYARGMTQRKRLQIGAAATLATIIPVLGFAPVTAGPIEDGVAAYVRGDNETAVRLIRPLAEQGDARAQYHLGTLYFTGTGVPQDYAEALKWFRLSADQGNPEGQGALGSCTTRVGACRTTFSHTCGSTCPRHGGDRRKRRDCSIAPNDPRADR